MFAKEKLPEPDAFALDAAASLLMPADAENKLHHRKLYLVLDLDETLVYSKRMEAGATPVGTQIFVREQPFDMQPRPGLKHFLLKASQNFVISLYTMGDADYTNAVLRVIDPDGRFFKGGILCWRPTESRQQKSLQRAICDRRMALIVDDSIDVWPMDLANLCITRRFVGDKLDDGLMLISRQLENAHRAFYADAPPEGFSWEGEVEGTALRAPSSIYSVLADARGQLLAGCTIALTGVVTGLAEDNLDDVPLSVLIKLYGGETTMSVDAATHLVARRKEGWRSSPKIKRALARLQDNAPGFFAVWDDWLLDTLSSWQKQPEAEYSIALDADRASSPLPTVVTRLEAEALLEKQLADGDGGGNGGLPPRKRPRPDGLGVNGAVQPGLEAF